MVQVQVVRVVLSHLAAVLAQAVVGVVIKEKNSNVVFLPYSVIISILCITSVNFFGCIIFLFK